MMAANNGHVNCIRVLNASGAGISKQDRYDVTGALVSASSKECLDCVKELLEAGSGSNMIDPTIYILEPVVSSCWPSSPGDFTSKAKLLPSTI